MKRNWISLVINQIVMVIILVIVMLPGKQAVNTSAALVAFILLTDMIYLSIYPESVKLTD